MSRSQLTLRFEVSLDYVKLHEKLISSFKERNWRHRRYHKNGIEPQRYVEAHHVILKSLGGKDEDDNIVIVTPREHFILHKLLTKITPCKKTFAAIGCLQMTQGGRRLTTRQIGEAREMISKARSGSLTEEQLIKHHEKHLGKKRSAETCDRISKALVGKESKRKGIPLSEEAKAKMRKPKTITQTTCPHCGLSGAKHNMARYHFNKCKLAPASE
jgi:hypothetical protein